MRAEPVRGLQRERTALAWDRTALALIAAGLLVVRAAGPPYVGLLPLPGYVVTLLGAWILVDAGRRYRAGGGESAPVAPVLARAVGLAATLLGIYAIALLLVTR